MSLVGRQIGRYRILEQLGQGGMSVVYKGLDTALDREVAVKVLHPHLANKVESRKRLEREAKAVARLHHPNILEVFDYAGESAAEAFIVTEYIRGHTLRQFIAEDSLQPPEVAAMVVHEIASALSHAHDSGVLHRDLKPENVMVRQDGVLKLMDFGIAKILDRDEKMTMTGALVGSPAHMAPEIIEGEAAGAEADVFSLGTMLYLFATGKLPFTAPNTTATLKRILDCVYDDPRQVVPTVSDELAEIIGTCLQRQPSARYASAVKLRDALAEYLAGLGLSRPHEELKDFFLDPKGYRKALGPRITRSLLERAERFIAEKKPARALSALNQVLAHEPSNARAVELLGQMKARKLREQRAQRLRRLAVATGLGFIVLMSVLRGVDEATRPPDFALETQVDPAQVVLASVQWRPPPAPPQPERPPDGPAQPERPPDGPAQPDEPVKPPVTPPVSTKRPGPDAPQLPKLPLEPIDVAVVVRPFGYVRVDDGAKSVDALSRHQLKLPPGKHRFTVTCDLACEPEGRTSVVDVKAGEDVLLVAPLKPSLVSFQGYPPDAVVRLGAEERTVAETSTRPFRLVTPPGGSTELRHRFEFEVREGTQVIDRGARTADPGKPLIVVKGAP
ncbi:MAG: serine/threonine-protein kinase [Myxococcota bacterium]